MVNFAEFKTNLEGVLTKLTAIAEAVNKLEAGKVLSQEQVDELNDLVTDANDKAQAVIDDAGSDTDDEVA